MHISYLCIALFLLILVSGFFSGSETGMMSINRYRLRHMAKKGNRVAKRINLLLQRPDRLLGIILLGNTFANILASSLATIIAVRLLGDKGILVATVLLTLVILIFAEVAPKTLAAYYPEKFAGVVSLPLKLLLKLLYPLVWLINTVANGLLSLFGFRASKRNLDPLSNEELRSVVNEASGRIPSKHQEMLLRILDLEAMTVDDVMVPRNEVHGIDLDDSWDTILNQLTSSQHTRLLLYKDNIDNVIGILHLKRILNMFAQGSLNKETLQQTALEAYYIPEGTPLQTQLLHFQSHKVRSAVVVDEYGDIQGIVTLEDILEEIVGEFTTDIATRNRDVHPQQDGSFLVHGSANVRELNRSMSWKLPTEGPKTLSGLIIEYLETIPNSGTCMRIAGYPMEVVKVQDNIIKTARIIPSLRVVKPSND